MERRRLRLSHLLRSELSALLHRKVKDPRLGGLISVTEVELTPDLREARVYVSVLGGEEEGAEVVASLQGARSFFHRELGQRLDLRHIPSLTFYRDRSLEQGARLLQLMDDVAASSPPAPPDQGEHRRPSEPE